MAIGQSSIHKSLALSSLKIASLLLGTQSTENLLLGASAYLAAIRGSGWPLSLEQEAWCAVQCLPRDLEFVVIDAGANVGRWLEAFCRMAKSQGRMYAFEPQPGAAAKIRERKLDNCEVIQKALGEQTGRRTFYTSSETDTMGSLYERQDTFVRGREYLETEVEVMTLDDFVEQRKIDRINFMKVDMEGGELEALRGASECMRSGIIKALSFEFGISNVNSRVFFRDIFQFLVGHKYSVYRVTPVGRLIQLKSYTEDYECFARTSTFLAKTSEFAELS
jgi:FkbM family methyltransferase